MAAADFNHRLLEQAAKIIASGLPKKREISYTLQTRKYQDVLNTPDHTRKGEEGFVPNRPIPLRFYICSPFYLKEKEVNEQKTGRPIPGRRAS